MDNENNQTMITHYICTGGCKGVAPEAGNCQTAGCPRFGQPLIACSCTDGGHQVAEEKPAERSAPVA
jgi:hypothetical protein